MKITRPCLNSFGKVFLVVAGALLSSACDVTFINPLPDSLKVERDERLSGKWMVRDEEGGPGYVMFVNGANGEFNVHFESGDPHVVFRVTSVEIENSIYMVIKTTDAAKMKGYLLARYAIAGDKMKVWLLDDAKVKQAVRDGKLTGEIGKETYAGVMVTDNWVKVLNFLRTSGDDPFELLADFEKVADK